MTQTLIPLAEIGSARHGKHAGGVSQRYVLDEPGRRLILGCYDGKTATIDDLAQRLHVPRWKVKRWACELGVAPSRVKAKPWTAEDEQYVEQFAGRVRIRAIAQHLGRTEVAVRIRMKRFLGINKGADGYTMQRLCACLGCDHKKVERWIAAGWLRGARRQTERTAQGDMWLFTDAAVRALIVQHPQEIDPRRADWLWLVDVVAGGKTGIGALD